MEEKRDFVKLPQKFLNNRGSSNFMILDIEGHSII